MAYRYIVRSMQGSAEVERQLHAFSQEGWEPINFARAANGEYEVVLRREELEERAEAVLESLEASATDIVTPPLA